MSVLKLGVSPPVAELLGRKYSFEQLSENNDKNMLSISPILENLPRIDLKQNRYAFHHDVGVKYAFRI